MECIAVINQKGGVGKTATAANLGAALGQRGRRVLLVDLDPQGHLTAHFGLDGDSKGAGVYEILVKGLDPQAATHQVSPVLTVIPANIDLAAAEVELVSIVGREMILRDALASRVWPFDIAIIDCPPSLGILTLNALSAATQVLIPLQPHFLALQGVGKLLETTALVSQRINPQLKVAGVVICMYESATKLAGEVIADVTSYLESSRESAVPWRKARVFQTRVRRNVKLAEAPSYGQSIFEYAPRSHGALDYLALADELLVDLDGAARAAESAPVADASQPPRVASRMIDEIPAVAEAAPESLPAVDRVTAAPMTSEKAPILGPTVSQAAQSTATPVAHDEAAGPLPSGHAARPRRRAPSQGGIANVPNA